MRTSNNGPIKFNLKETAETLQEEADKINRSLHCIVFKILHDHVVKTNPGFKIEGVVKTEYQRRIYTPLNKIKRKVDPRVPIKLKNLKAPLREEASEMERPLSYLVLKILRSYIASLKKESCNNQSNSQKK